MDCTIALPQLWASLPLQGCHLPCICKNTHVVSLQAIPAHTSGSARADGLGPVVPAEAVLSRGGARWGAPRGADGRPTKVGCSSPSEQAAQSCGSSSKSRNCAGQRRAALGMSQYHSERSTRYGRRGAIAWQVRHMLTQREGGKNFVASCCHDGCGQEGGKK